MFKETARKYLDLLEERFKRQIAYVKKIPRKFLISGGIILLAITLILAAQSALPGNPLYGIKIYVNEKFGGLFAFTKSQKAARSLELSGNRLEEGLQLLSSADLQKQKAVTLIALLKDGLREGEANITALQNDKDTVRALDAANRFEANLAGYESIFLKIRAEKDGALEQMDSLGVELDSHLAKVRGVRVALEAVVLANNDNAGLDTQARKNIDEAGSLVQQVRELILKNKKILGDDQAAFSESRMKDTENILLEAKKKCAEKMYGMALTLANQALRITAGERVFLDMDVGIYKKN